MKNIIFKKLGTIVLALLIGVSVFSLFPNVTKAETTNVTWTNGSLVTSLGNVGQSDKATVGKTKGKWYWEVKVNYSISLVGITGESGPKYQAYYGYSGQIINNITSDVRTAYGPTFAKDDVIGVALDLDNDKIVWYKNGVSLGANTVKPSELEGSQVFPMVMNGTSGIMTYEANFGASEFKYPIPEGFYLIKLQVDLQHPIHQQNPTHQQSQIHLQRLIHQQSPTHLQHLVHLQHLGRPQHLIHRIQMVPHNQLVTAPF